MSTNDSHAIITQGHNLNRLGSTSVPMAVSNLFWRRRFLKVLTIYGGGSHVGQKTHALSTTLYSSSLGGCEIWLEMAQLFLKSPLKLLTDDGTCLLCNVPKSRWLRGAKNNI